MFEHNLDPKPYGLCKQPAGLLYICAPIAKRKSGNNLNTTENENCVCEWLKPLAWRNFSWKIFKMSDALSIQHDVIRQKHSVKNHLFFIYLLTDIKNKALIIYLFLLIVHVVELTGFVCRDKWPLAARPRKTKQKRNSKTEVIFQCITLCNLISFVPYCEQICLSRIF